MALASARTSAARATQNDALRLDADLASTLRITLSSILHRLHLSASPAVLTAAVRAAILAGFVLRGSSPPGAALLGLSVSPVSGRGHPTFLQRAALLALTLALPHAPPRWAGLRAVLALFSLLSFLRGGGAPSLPLRLAGLRLNGGAIGPTDLLDRQLLLQAAADLALVLAPAARVVLSTLRPPRPRPRRAAPGTCVVCASTPTMPHALVPCRCQACHACAAGLSAACPGCGTAVVARTRLSFA